MRFFFMGLAQFMYFGTTSKAHRFVKTSVFWATFFQTGLICILAFISIDFQSSFFSPGGIYNDFNAYYFLDAGKFMVSTFVSQMMFPVVEFFLRYSIRTVKRAYD
jgi:hypothetical protein